MHSKARPWLITTLVLAAGCGVGPAPEDDAQTQASALVTQAAPADPAINVDDPAPPLPAVTAVTVDDPLYSLQQWYLEAAQIPEAWSVTMGSSSVVVALLDSGRPVSDTAETDHPDLPASRWVGGYDFWDPSRTTDATEPVVPAIAQINAQDYFGPNYYPHGAHVAGIVGAKANNNQGIAGVCSGCELLPVRVLSIEGTSSPCGANDYACQQRILAKGVLFAAGLPIPDDGAGNALQGTSEPRAKVINISLGNDSTACTPELQSAIDQAINAGSVIIAAAADVDPSAGFTSTAASSYRFGHCTNPGLIVVTAADPSGNGNGLPYASLGPPVTIAAPGGDAGGSPPTLAGYGQLIDNAGQPVADKDEQRGVGTHGIVSTWMTHPQFSEDANFFWTLTSPPKAIYRHWAGTSMATPIVSGVVGLMVSQNANLNASKVKALLQATAKPIACTGTSPTSCGAGLIDAFKAVKAATHGPLLTASATSVDFGGAPVGQPVTASLTLNSVGVGPVTLARMHIDNGGGQFTFASPCASGVECDQVQVAQDASLTLSLRCQPALGSQSATLVLESDSLANPTVSIPLTCQGQAPRLVITPASLAFGPVNLAPGSKQLGVQLANTGNAPLVFTATQAAGPFLLNGCSAATCTCSDTACNVTVPAGQSASLSVAFVPRVHGAQSSALTITSNDPLAPTVSVPESGTGVQGALSISPSTYDFGDVLRYTSTPSLTVTLTNTGDGPLSITNTSFSAHHCVFDSSPSPQQIPPGATSTLSFHCPAPNLGFVQDTLMVATDVPGLPVKFALFSYHVVPGPVASIVRPTNGIVTLPATAPNNSMTLINSGNQSLTITAASFPRAVQLGVLYRADGPTLPLQLAPNETATWTFSCSNVIGGSRQRTFTLTHNALPTNTTSVTVVCNGTDVNPGPVTE